MDVQTCSDRRAHTPTSVLKDNVFVGASGCGSAACQRVGDIVTVTSAKEVCRTAVEDGCVHRAGVHAGDGQEAEPEEQQQEDRAKADHDGFCGSRRWCSTLGVAK